MEKINKLTEYKPNKTKLLIDLEETLKDKEFEEYISKLGLSKEILAKYTTILQSSFKEYKNCRNCKGLAACSNKITGYVYCPLKSEKIVSFKYMPCKYQKKAIKENNYLQNVYTFNEPKEIKQAKMSEIYTKDTNRFDTIIWLKNFIEDYKNKKDVKGLFLHGNFGCGKTYLISAMFNELAKSNIKSAIVFWPEFLNELKNSFNGDKNEFKNKFNKIKKTPILLIDDIGAENTTAWERDEILSPILQYRMQESLPTFFTSNFDLELLEKHFSSTSSGVEEVKSRRIMERIKQLTIEKKIESKNYRK